MQYRMGNNWYCLIDLLYISNSITVLAKIKEMPRSYFYDIPCFATMDYEKLHTSILFTKC